MTSPKAPSCEWPNCTDPQFVRGLCNCHYYRMRRGKDMDAPKRAARASCKRAGCDEPHLARGLCGLHYNQARRDAALMETEPEWQPRHCTWPGCGDVIAARDLCGMHYARQREGRDMDAPRPRRRAKNAPPPKCEAPGCTEESKGGGYCYMHYRRHRLGKNTAAPRRHIGKRAGPQQCSVTMADGKCCTNLRKHANGMCPMHWQREQQGTDLARPKRVQVPSRIDADGYRQIRRPDGRYAPEHRALMENMLGRPLRRGETVHHRNGQRADNTTNGPLDRRYQSGNLELWSKTQPAGQRVADKLEWAVELLREYAPEQLAPGLAEAPSEGAPGDGAH